MSEAEYESEAGVMAIADLAREGTSAELIEAKNGRQLMLHQPGLSIVDITSQHGLHTCKPEYIKQRVSLQKVDSLVEYLNRYKNNETTVFADISSNRLVGVIDYHGTEANFLAHVAHTQLRVSEEWALWTKNSGQMMRQLDFARFVEENAADISHPAAGEILDAVRDLQSARKKSFTGSVRTSSDNENFSFASETDARGAGGIELPTKFTLYIPVYFGEQPVQVKAFLRSNVEESGALSLGLVLSRTEFVRQAEFERIALDVADATDCQVLYGTINDK